MDIEAGGKEYRSQAYPGILSEVLQALEIPSPNVSSFQRRSRFPCDNQECERYSHYSSCNQNWLHNCWIQWFTYGNEVRKWI